MKTIFTILITVLLTTTALAQSPQKMSYQAVIRDVNDALVTNTQVGMQISILQGSASGTVVYTETHTPITNANGLISIEIGGGAGFNAIDWANDNYFIKTETDLSGGINYTITGTSQLLSVPYALHAKTAESITGSPGGFTHYIGELYGGGIVVAVWKENGIEKGLIASLTNIGIAPWSSVTATVIGATAQSLSDGQANTTAIVNQGDTNGAAFLCDNYSAGGFNDWYLPALWELNQCYNAAFVVNTILGTTNGFVGAFYWSSTEHSTGTAWYKSLLFGTADSTNKSYGNRVRAIRRF
ncbi:MAG: DUF1566 domain-containing protein [Bacteroidales bacterium]|nr:DUF1566 domain-containing protein [Bacteroidales bacterium]MCF8458695.1 DUF1566 domain-containing protein [Bacteroidales bacterium]